MSSTIHDASAPAVVSLPTGPALFSVGYAPASLREAALADPCTLAVFGFGARDAQLDGDPRWLQVPLAEHGPAQV